MSGMVRRDPRQPEEGFSTFSSTNLSTGPSGSSEDAQSGSRGELPAEVGAEVQAGEGVLGDDRLAEMGEGRTSGQID